MAVYIVLYIGIIVAYFFEKKQLEFNICSKTVTAKQIANTFVFILFLFIGIFRYRFLGVDVANYGDYFKNYVETLSWGKLLTDLTMDNGYYLFNKIVKLFIDDYWVFKGILFTLTFTIYHMAIKNVSKNVSFSYIIFLGAERLVGIFCILRQEVSIAICVYAIKYIKNKDWKKFIVVVLIAATFHKTALAFLFAYVFVYIKKDNLLGIKNGVLKKFDNKYFLATFGISLISIVIVPILIKWYPIDYSGGMIIGSGMTKLTFIIVSLVLFGVLKEKIELEEKEEINTLYDICYCSLFPQIVAFFFPIFSRITSYFFIYFMFLIPNLLENIKIKKKEYIVLFYFIAFSVLYFNSLSGGEIVPFIFESF